MMKVLKITMFSLMSSGILYANSTEDFFYQRGYENGYSNGYEQGVKEAFEEAKKILFRYKDELQAYEIGKYLIKNKNLTYPQIWQEVDGNNRVVLKIEPSQIQKEIDVEELFVKYSNIPLVNKDKEPTLELTLEEKNSVITNKRDSNLNDLPQKVSQANSTITLSVKKNSKTLEILKKSNVVFSDEGDSYNVLFFTDTEKTDFCKQFKICN